VTPFIGKATNKNTGNVAWLAIADARGFHTATREGNAKGLVGQRTLVRDQSLEMIPAAQTVAQQLTLLRNTCRTQIGHR
jgi:hypothetical protein